MAVDVERWFVLGGAGMSVGLLVLSIQRSLMLVAQRYRERYTDDAAHSLRDLYMFLDVKLLWPLILWLALAVFLVTIWCGAGWLLASMLSTVCLAMPSLLIRYAKSRRLLQFERQLPDALQTLATALAAGTSLVGALHTLVQYAPMPLAQELSVIEREVRLGVSLENALQHLMSRMPCQGVQALGATLMVAMQTGGQMAEMLSETSASLVGELHVQQKARALMSQGWMQAWVIGCLPLGLMLVLAKMDARFWPALSGTWPGHLLLMCLALMESIGMLWLRRIAQQVAEG